MIKVLINLVKDIQATGGLIEFSDGLHAPMADPAWIDLGETVLKAHEALVEAGVDQTLDIDIVDYSSKEDEY